MQTSPGFEAPKGHRYTSRMAKPLVFWFEFASTYSYPASQRIGLEAARADVPLRWAPFLLGPIFAAQGWKDSPFNLFEAKGAYMWKDLERVCAALELPWRKPSLFPRGSLSGARLACAAQQETWQPDFIRAVYRANFAEDRAIDKTEVLAEILQDLGLDAKSELERASTDLAKQALRSATDQAQACGVFGAPSFSVGNELFWGNDRLEQAIAHAASPAIK